MILCIMDFTKSEGISGILAFLDFEKAPDSTELNFIHRCLEVFGFGSDFIRWFSVIYKDISSCVCDNGIHLNYFILCHLTSVFITAVELLSINIISERLKLRCYSMQMMMHLGFLNMIAR